METRGEKIRRLRKAKGLTLQGLANIVGASKSSIWELENRDVPRVSAQRLVTIAEALGTTVDFLIVDSGNRFDQAASQDKVFYLNYLRLKPKDKSVLRMLAKAFDEKPY